MVVALGCALSLQQSAAGPLTSAQITKIINRVRVVDPVKGSSITAVSARLPHERINAVEKFLGPDHMAIRIAMTPESRHQPPLASF